MAKASRSKRFDSPADEMWARVGGWDTIHEWHPVITSTQVSADGQSRTLTLGDGGSIFERLLEQGERSYTYRSEESPLPVTDYQSTIRVRPADGGSIIEWETQFTPKGIDEAQAVELIEGIYQAGLDAL